jgi:tetratricopeptide (TPR) repeat protein
VVTSAVTEGDQLAAEKKFKEAGEAYRRAREKVMATKGLTGDEQAAFFKDIDAKVQQIQIEQNYQTQMELAETHKQQGLPEQELAALLAAGKIRPAPDAVKTRIAKLHRAIDRDAAEKAVNNMASPTATKITAMEAFVAKYPDDDWGKTMLGGLKNEDNRRDMVTKGQAAFEAKDWAKAIEAFRQATAIMPDKALDEKVTECRYQILMEKARALFADKKYEDALGKAEEAMKESPAHEADVRAFQAEVTAVKNFELLMQRATDAFKGQLFGQAKDFLDRAKKAMPSRAAEVDVMLKKVEYRQLVSQGDDAMTTEAYPSARFMYERAQKIDDTEEVRRKLEQVRTKMGGS